MNAEPECLILEDDPRRLDSLSAAAELRGLHPLPTRSAPQALSMLRNRTELTPPIIAIIDRDLRYAPDQSKSALDVLQYLASTFPDCLVLVYSANINEIEARNQITRAHPLAHLQDKDIDDDNALFLRIEKMLGKTVGDLRVTTSAVRHTDPNCLVCHPQDGSSGRNEYKHWVAVQLVAKYPEPVWLRTDTMTKAERRFRDWLRQHHSCVETVAMDARKYRLQVTKSDPSSSS